MTGSEWKTERMSGTVRSASGSWFGSYLWLIVAALPAPLVWVPFAITGSVGWVLPIGTAIAICVLPAVLRPMYRVSVGERGVDLSLGPMQLNLDWAEIASIRERTFGADLIFKSPIPFGIRKRRKIPLVMLDPSWRQRPIAVAALICFKSSLVTDTAA